MMDDNLDDGSQSRSWMTVLMMAADNPDDK